MAETTGGIVRDPGGARARPAGRPTGVQLGGQRIFVLRARHGGRRRVLVRRRDDENTHEVAGRGSRMDPARQDDVAILVKRLQRVS